jgi:hypothetical protein
VPAPAANTASHCAQAITITARPVSAKQSNPDSHAAFVVGPDGYRRETYMGQTNASVVEVRDQGADNGKSSSTSSF